MVAGVNHICGDLVPAILVSSIRDTSIRENRKVNIKIDNLETHCVQDTERKPQNYKQHEIIATRTPQKDHGMTQVLTKNNQFTVALYRIHLFSSLITRSSNSKNRQ